MIRTFFASISVFAIAALVGAAPVAAAIPNGPTGPVVAAKTTRPTVQLAQSKSKRKEKEKGSSSSMTKKGKSKAPKKKKKK